ncbi:MAG: TPM domain-containing protein [Gemmatimonadota bacterium]
MLISAVLTAVTLQATPAQVQRIRWVPNPRRTSGTWVADPSRHLADSTVTALNREISALESANGSEIAVVVVDSTSGLTPFDFALAIHRGWGVGKAGRDNGVVLLWVPTQRAIQISVGYGLEGAIPDRMAGRIRDQQIIAAFRRNAFDEGILAGVRALAAAARAETSARQGITPRMQTGDGGAARPGTARSGAVGSTSSGGGAIGIFFTIVFFAALGGGGYALLRGWRRTRRRRCPKCRTKMDRLNERADDAFLDKAERVEEKLRSVDYDVWKCGACSEAIKIAYSKKWSGVEECPQCKHRTMQVRQAVVRSATESAEGMARVIAKCENCGHKTEHSKVLPRIVSSSSSSSSSGWSSSDSSGGGGGGGSDFGGGSAGGGGAGGTY